MPMQPVPREISNINPRRYAIYDLVFKNEWGIFLIFKLKIKGKMPVLKEVSEDPSLG